MQLMQQRAVLAILGVFITQAAMAAVADFEQLTLPLDSASPGDASQVGFDSGDAHFNRTWGTEFDCCPGAWAYSNQTDLTTAGFANSYSAYAIPNGGGVNGSANFAIANNRVQGEASVRLPGPSRISGMHVTNTTYAYLTVVEGDDGAGFVKGPFSDGDWFRLDIVGLDSTGQELGVVEFYLADYRNGQSAIADWTWVDMTALGDTVERLEFRMDSTDVGVFGMNTPAYFAIDDLTYEVVPEPSGLALGLGALLVAVRSTRRVRRKVHKTL